MPRKDQITGCKVLTMGEFFVREAQHKGTTPAQEFESFTNDMNQMLAEDEKRMREQVANPIEALKILLEGLQWSNEGVEPEDVVKAPTAVVETFDFEFHETLNTSSLKFKARVDDGRVLAYSQSSYSGSFYEPPDGETIVEEIAA